MPADPAALTALGAAHPTAYSNSTIVPDPVLAPLTDIFALPTWVPFSNVFSIGDVLIGIGVGVVIVTAMRALGSTVDGRSSAARRRLNRLGARRVPAAPGPPGAGRQLPPTAAGYWYYWGIGTRGWMSDSATTTDFRPAHHDRSGQTRREAGTQSQGSRKRPPGRRSGVIHSSLEGDRS